MRSVRAAWLGHALAQCSSAVAVAAAMLTAPASASVITPARPHGSRCRGPAGGAPVACGVGGRGKAGAAAALTGTVATYPPSIRVGTGPIKPCGAGRQLLRAGSCGWTPGLRVRRAADHRRRHPSSRIGSRLPLGSLPTTACWSDGACRSGAEGLRAAPAGGHRRPAVPGVVRTMSVTLVGEDRHSGKVHPLDGEHLHQPGGVPRIAAQLAVERCVQRVYAYVRSPARTRLAR